MNNCMSEFLDIKRTDYIAIGSYLILLHCVKYNDAKYEPIAIFTRVKSILSQYSITAVLCMRKIAVSLLSSSERAF